MNNEFALTPLAGQTTVPPALTRPSPAPASIQRRKSAQLSSCLSSGDGQRVVAETGDEIEPSA
jgi:hypothetical protein